MDYKISVIISTFNVEEYISNTINSVINQSIGFHNIDLIIVDDYSSDSTVNNIINYVNNYENINLIKLHKNSGGAGKPRNIGISHAKSELILFLDGDDFLEENSLEILYGELINSSSDLVCGGFKNQFSADNSEYIPPFLSKNKKILFNKVNQNPILLNLRPAISAKLFRKKIILENDIYFLENIPGEDLFFLLKYILSSNNIILINKSIYHRIIRYNSDNCSISNILDISYFKGLLKAYTKVSELLDEYKIDANIQEFVLLNHYQFFFNQLLRTNLNLNQIFHSKVFREFKKSVIHLNQFYYYLENINDDFEDDMKCLKLIMYDNKEKMFNNILKYSSPLDSYDFCKNLFREDDNLFISIRSIYKFKKKLLDNNRKYNILCLYYDKNNVFFDFSNLFDKNVYNITFLNIYENFVEVNNQINLYDAIIFYQGFEKLGPFWDILNKIKLILKYESYCCIIASNIFNHDNLSSYRFSENGLKQLAIYSNLNLIYCHDIYDDSKNLDYITVLICQRKKQTFKDKFFRNLNFFGENSH